MSYDSNPIHKSGQQPSIAQHLRFQHVLQAKHSAYSIEFDGCVGLLAISWLRADFLFFIANQIA